MTVSPSITQTEPIVVRPSYRLPFGLALLALPLVRVSVWLYLPFFAFALFLTVQAATLRLHFMPSTLAVYRGQKQIRSFPYADWYHWEIYWPAVPILFYFREVNSIHFLPVLFDPATLTQCLSAYCPRKAA
jgi:hypothetical protein